MAYTRRPHVAYVIIIQARAASAPLTPPSPTMPHLNLPVGSEHKLVPRFGSKRPTTGYVGRSRGS